jgi:hypothetical protein
MELKTPKQELCHYALLVAFIALVVALMALAGNRVQKHIEDAKVPATETYCRENPKALKCRYLAANQ